MEYFQNDQGKPILLAMVRAIQDNRDFLSEIDGLIGDGDHGVNMAKGFTRFEQSIAHQDVTLTEGLEQLGSILLNEIGGSMGPIYGTIFSGMAESAAQRQQIDLAVFVRMLRTGLDDLHEIIEAQVGDKTLVDTLSPAVEALEQAAAQGDTFSHALETMKGAAASGRDSTKDQKARFGRSSRLGERSRGVLDAGAASCYILLQSMAEEIQRLLREGDGV